MDLSGPIADCLAGRISAPVALARMMLAGGTAATIGAALGTDPALAPLRALLHGRAARVDTLAAEVAATVAQHNASGPTPEAGIARIAAFFDRAVAHSPEASVALYSLGDPAILQAATDEVVGWLGGGGLLRAESDVLDLGCGIGRIAAALAPRCGSVLGLDVSPGMVAEARRRHAGLANVRFQPTGGQDLDALAPASLDLVLAVDSFPYIVQTGPDIADRHAGGAARALRPGGALCILNLSYRGDPDQDRADTQAWAARHGFTVAVAGSQPFALWDGAAFVLRR